MRFENEKRFDIHKGVHGLKSKVSQYGKDMSLAQYYILTNSVSITDGIQ
jgi:hypothetical protein